VSYLPPKAEEQIKFLAKVQRLLNEGGGKFSASYKFALFLVLADLAVEKGEDTGKPMKLTIPDIAEKFIEYYWSQARPFPSVQGKRSILIQNTDASKQAAIINWLSEAGDCSPQALYKLRSDSQSWQRMVNRVGRLVVKMPLWRLQTIGDEDHTFLYENRREVKRVKEIVLLPGVMYCLRRFHELLVDLVQGAWIRFLRGIDQNIQIIGESHDLQGFLFGNERQVLSVYRNFLGEMQKDKCFYCKGALLESYDIDHFVPWSRYPTDLGHNFVAAHKKCNNSKRDYLTSERFLARWMNRNEKCRDYLQEEFVRYNILHNEESSLSITGWAYEQAQKAQSYVWDGKGHLIELAPTWKRLFYYEGPQSYIRAAEESERDDFKFDCQ